MLNDMLFTMNRAGAIFCCHVLILAAGMAEGQAEDQPQWGRAWTRNMVSSETGLPSSFNLKTGRNVKWVARLGTEAHSTPVIAHGRVYIGTNNNEPRDPEHQGDRGVLMCLDEKDGKLLWQLVVPKREEDRYFDWPNSGISSPATVEGDRVYIVSNRGEVMCLDAAGLTDGNDGPYLEEARHMTPAGREPMALGPLDADILWLFDLTEGAGIWSHDAAHSSILIHGPHLYLNSGTGVDNTHKRIRTPDAPSLVVLEKATGRLLARDRERMAPDIFHCTWSAPALAEVNGQPQILFAGGNGILYGFETLATNAPLTEPVSLKKIWQFDCDPAAPKENVHRYTSNKREGPSNVFGMPVYHGGRVYVAGGGDYWWGKLEAWLKCIDPTGRGDVTATHEIWSHDLTRHVMATPAVTDELVFVTDSGRLIHCVDRATGRSHWTHEAEGDFWASAYVADGKVYAGSRRGDFWIFAADKTKKQLHQADFGMPISATAVAANGVLYVATMTYLYAFEEGTNDQQH